MSDHIRNQEAVVVGQLYRRPEHGYEMASFFFAHVMHWGRVGV